jgi:asparagine synthase (glutamine-hydrolysing)
MCGIAGAYRPEGRVDVGRLRRMSALLRHRGPDDEGVVLLQAASGRALTLPGTDTPREVLASGLPFAPGRSGAGPSRPGFAVEAPFQVGLVHRRLAIVDLSPSGHGPLCDAAGECWITYNGEIYNHVELRRELEEMGERFQGGSDTEVLLAAYRRFGAACLPRLNGMFALAIWDTRRRELFCARDRLGVKPFYYRWRDGEFLFASEPKALVLSAPGRPAVRADAVLDFLALDWVDHEAATFFEDVQQLPPGHCLTLGADGGRLEQWWRLAPGRAGGDRGERERRFAELFTDAVSIRLRADVEVGSCLSGGLDSSAVVTTAASLSARPLHAFTSAYEEGPSFDERPWVRAVVAKSGVQSHVVVPDGGDFWTAFDRIAAQQDEPTAGPGLYSQWKVMELAHRAGLKVLLDGQGGDETLAGYGRYLPTRVRDLLARGRPGDAVRLLAAVAARFGTSTALALTFEPWLPGGLIGPLRRRFGQGKDRVLSPALRGRARDRARALPRPPRGFPSGLSRHLAFDTCVRMLPSLLRYEDRNSMAFAIEARLPFLDYRLVEFAFSLPDEDRLDGTTTKAILRRAMADRVPAVVLERRDKMGFETPSDLWLRGRFAGEVRRRLLAPGPLHEWLDRRALEVELDDFLAGRRPIGQQVWRWLSLESWLAAYVANPARGAHPAPAPAAAAAVPRWQRTLTQDRATVGAGPR